MSEVINSVGAAIAMSIISWVLVMVPTCAALAYRRGYSVGIGALLGCIPVPFVGWALVYALSSGDQRGLANLDLSGPDELPVGSFDPADYDWET